MHTKTLLATALVVLAPFTTTVDAATVEDDDGGTCVPPAGESGAGAYFEGTELRARADGTSVWMQRNVTIEPGDGMDLALAGRSSDELAGIRSWIRDGAGGELEVEARITGPRGFELLLHDHVDAALSGAPIFVRLRPAGPEERFLTARLRLAPRFTRFAGSSALFVHSDIRPIFVRDEQDPLRYRGQVTSEGVADAVRVYTSAGDGSPEVTRAAGGLWIVDWSADALASALSAEAVYFSAGFGPDMACKSAVMQVRTAELALTVEDPDVMWPEPRCEGDVWACMQTHGDAPDLAMCGDYLEVQRCTVTDTCDAEAPWSPILTHIDASALQPAVQAFDDTCVPGGYVWCGMDSARAYKVTSCSSLPVSLEAVVEELRHINRSLRGVRFAWGHVFDRLGLFDTPFFGTTYSPAGPGLLATIDAFADDTEVEAWIVSRKQACHNCTEFRDTVVLWYPAARMVVVLRGMHGYDS